MSIVSYVDYLQYFCHIPLSTTTRQLYVYSGSPLVVAGEITMLVVKADKQALPLFGRSWLRVIKVTVLMRKYLFHIPYLSSEKWLLARRHAYQVVYSLRKASIGFLYCLIEIFLFFIMFILSYIV